MPRVAIIAFFRDNGNTSPRTLSELSIRYDLSEASRVITIAMTFLLVRRLSEVKLSYASQLRMTILVKEVVSEVYEVRSNHRLPIHATMVVTVIRV